MRTILPSFTAALLGTAILAVPSVGQQTPDTRPGVAVMPFSAGASIGWEREAFEALTIGVQQILITELATNAGLRLVDRSIIRDLIAEQDLGASGRIDDETAARIGRIVGAKYVVTGVFNDVGEFRLDGRIVDSETSEVLRTDQVTDQRTNLYRIITNLGNRITDGVQLPALPRVQRQQQEARAAETPREAIVLYSMAQRMADQGRTEQARELYRRITVEFPQYTHAREALRQIGGG